jgi:uncharacterized protein YjiS (DUF1127 family)
MRLIIPLGGTVTSASADQESSAILSVVHALQRRSFALSTNPSARAFCAPKETIMLHELRQRFARWLAYRQTLASLRRAPDSTLADAGISREEIHERARYASLRR